MTVDYGVRRRRGWLPLGAVIGAVTLTAAVAGVVEHDALAKRRALNFAAAAELTVTGAACPQLSAREFAARRLSAPQVFEYRDIAVGRKVGHVSCGALAYRGGRSLFTFPVCQFTGPVTLRVKTPKGEFFFAPGVGQPATISVPHGVPRCVLASHFTL